LALRARRFCSYLNFHRRARGGRNLDQVEPLRLGERERLAHRQHSDLLPIVSDDPDLRHSDTLVDANFGLLDGGNDVPP